MGEIRKLLLLHRSGTMLEDMYWIDAVTGETVAKVLNEKKEHTISYSDSIHKAIYGKENIVAMHTHPHSMPPSIADFNSAYVHNYFISLVLCHDGKIFCYKSLEIVSEQLYNMYIERFIESGVREYQAQMETLKRLTENHRMHFEEVMS